MGLGQQRPGYDVLQGVQRGSTATGADGSALWCTGEDGDLRRWTPVDGLPADGMQEVRGSNPRSPLPAQSHKFEQTAIRPRRPDDGMLVSSSRFGRARFRWS